MCVCVYLVSIVEYFKDIASVVLYEAAFDAKVCPWRLHGSNLEQYSEWCKNL